MEVTPLDYYFFKVVAPLDYVWMSEIVYSWMHMPTLLAGYNQLDISLQSKIT